MHHFKKTNTTQKNTPFSVTKPCTKSRTKHTFAETTIATERTARRHLFKMVIETCPFLCINCTNALQSDVRMHSGLSGEKCGLPCKYESRSALQMRLWATIDFGDQQYVVWGPCEGWGDQTRREGCRRAPEWPSRRRTSTDVYLTVAFAKLQAMSIYYKYTLETKYRTTDRANWEVLIRNDTLVCMDMINNFNRYSCTANLVLNSIWKGNWLAFDLLWMYICDCSQLIAIPAIDLNVL